MTDWQILLGHFQRSKELAPTTQGQEKLEKILGFIGLCFTHSDVHQAFADTAGGRPTITATDGAIQLLDSCGVWSSRKPRDVKIPQDLRDPVAVSAKLVDFITACGKPGSLGFANHPSEQLPQSDVTRYCFRTLATLKKILQTGASMGEKRSPPSESPAQDRQLA